MTERNDEWSRVRRQWRAATDACLRAMVVGRDGACLLEALREVAGLSIRLRLMEQGRRSVR